MSLVPLPKEAVEWICCCIPNRNAATSNLEYMRRPSGLDMLTLAELKMVDNVLRMMETVAPHAKAYIARSSKKSKWVAHVRASFFQDPTCDVINQKLMKELEKDMAKQQQPHATTTTPSKRSSPTSSSKKKHRKDTPGTGHGASNGNGVSPYPAGASAAAMPMAYNQPFQVQHPQYAYPPHFPGTAVFNPWGPIAFPTATTATPSAASYPPPQHFAHMMSMPHYPPSASAQSAAASNQSTNNTPTNDQKRPLFSPNTNSSKKTKSKKKTTDSHQERSDISAATATNSAPTPSLFATPVLSPDKQYEKRLILELMQAGFQNPAEVMKGIRAQDGPIQEVTSEQVLFWLLAEREKKEERQHHALEMAEARQMDLARLRSEEYKEEQEEKRKQAAKELLENATTIDQLKEIFPQSWILGGSKNILQSIIDTSKEVRRQVNELLNLESKAKKWYGSLPQPYFDKQRGVLEATTVPAKRKKWIQEECDRLQKGLYELENQKGGVPKMFLAARDECLKVNGDSEVVLIRLKDGSTIRSCEVVEID